MAAGTVARCLPAWAAMRVAALDAIAQLATPARSRVPWKLPLVGLLLICIDPFLMFGPMGWTGLDEPVVRTIRVYGHFAAGVPGMMIGFFMLSPLFVWVIEHSLGPMVA